jgi:cell division septation protein DedD
MRKTGWVLPPVILAGLTAGSCSLPPAIIAASYSADAVSYIETGKTVTDHAYSAVARSDCSMIRVLSGKPICVDPPEAAPAAPPPQLAALPAPAESERGSYVTIGSFTVAANAARSLARYAEFRPMIMPVTVHGRQFQRVVAGPLSDDEAEALRIRMAAG